MGIGDCKNKLNIKKINLIKYLKNKYTNKTKKYIKI